MTEQMAFPNTWEEYEEYYGFTDSEQIYTNGARLIMSFRVKQWLNHLPSAERKGKWIDVNSDGSLWRCNQCKDTACCKGDYCPNCGARMVNE